MIICAKQNKIFTEYLEKEMIKLYLFLKYIIAIPEITWRMNVGHFWPMLSIKRIVIQKGFLFKIRIYDGQKTS